MWACTGLDTDYLVFGKDTFEGLAHMLCIFGGHNIISDDKRFQPTVKQFGCDGFNQSGFTRSYRATYAYSTGTHSN